MPLLQSGKKTGRTFAAVLNKRCSIQALTSTPTDSDADGIFGTAPLQQSYTTLLSVWCQIVDNNQNDYIRAIRGVNAAEDITHYIRVRMESIKYLGASFTDGFSVGFKTIDDMNPVKQDHFVLLETAIAGRGRRLRILGLARDEVNTEFLLMKCSEMREVGTGYGN